jgi:hypothetical protein
MELNENEDRAAGCLATIAIFALIIFTLWWVGNTINEVTEVGLKNIVGGIWNGTGSVTADSTVVDSVIVLGTKRYKLIEE